MYLSRRAFLSTALAAPLATQGVFAQTPSPPLEVYGRLPAFELPKISPSGVRLAFVTTVDQRRVLFARKLKDAKSAPLKIALADIKLRDLRWVDDRYLIGHITDTHQPGFSQGTVREVRTFFVVDCETGESHWPMQGARRLNATFGQYGLRKDDEGRWKMFVGGISYSRSSQGENYFAGGAVQLLELDILSGASKILAAAAEDHEGWVIGENRRIVAHDRYSPSRREWSLHRGNSSEVIWRQSDSESSFALVGLGRRPNTLTCKMETAERDLAYFEFDLNESSPKPVAIEFDKNISRPLFDQQTGLLIGAMTTDPGRWPKMFDRKFQARLDGVRDSLPGYVLSFESASADFNHITFHSDGHDDSGTWWYTDIASGKSDDIGWSYPEIRRNQVGYAQTISHKAGDGLEIEGLFTVPPGDRKPKNPLPLVVLPHGGPASHDSLSFGWWAQAFASRGYAVWQPNFRGSTGYGSAFRRAGKGQWGRAMQTDVSDGVAELARRGLIDAKRVCIVGASYGGYVALAGVTLQKKIYRCAVSVAGVCDIEEFVEYLDNKAGEVARQYFLDFFDRGNRGSRGLAALSPARRAAEADAPILLVHGKDDSVVPYFQTYTMGKALKAANKPVEVVDLAGEDHWLSREATRVAMLKAVVSFVMKHNPPS